MAKAARRNLRDTVDGINEAGWEQAMAEPQLPEVVEQQVDAHTVGAWFGNMTGFFLQARELEQAALVTRDIASTMTVPQSVGEDAALQKFVQKTTTDKKALEAHWSIAQALHRLHRRVTSRRDIGVKALEEANLVGNRLHNAYVAAEEKRAREEEQRLRDKAEREAREAREAEQARMEAEAAAREEASPDLSDRERRFVDLVVAGYTGQRAATSAGYQNALATSARLLSSAKIQAAMKALQDAAEIRKQAAVRAREPLIVEAPEVKPNVVQATGTFERTTHGCELFDEKAFIAAVCSGQFGLDASEFLTVRPAALTNLARSMKERMNLIPGVRYKATTKVI